MSKLAIVQCGKRKIWQKNPNLRKEKAGDAYTSPYFKKNKIYAQLFSDKWMILSAKYGFLDPDDLIENYDVTFNDLNTNPISIAILKKQVADKRLADYEEAIVLGGENYLLAVKGAFEGTRINIVSPFMGLTMGAQMHAINEAIKNLSSTIKKNK